MPRELTSRRRMDMQRHPQAPSHSTAPSYVVHESAGPGDTAALGSLTAPLWRGKKTITAAAAVGLLLGGGTSFLMTPMYRARTSVQLEGFTGDQVTPISASLPNASPENYLQNQVKVLESDTLAKRVANALDNGSQNNRRLRDSWPSS